MHVPPHPAQYKVQQQLGGRPHQSTIPRGGQSPALLASNRHARPVDARSGPVPGTAALAVRGNGGDRFLLLPKGASRGDAAAAGSGPRSCSPCRGSPVPGGRGGRGAPPTLSPGAVRLGQGRTNGGTKWQTERQRSSSQESFASEHSLYSSPSQSSSFCTSGARQPQARNPAKPPPPSGPPPPHILEEQRKRRELAAQQRAQQQSPSAGGGGSGPPHGGVEQRSLSNSRSFRDPQPRSSNSPRNRPVGDPMHLVQAGASILSNGTSNIKPSGSGPHFTGARSGEPTVGCALEAAAGFSHNLNQTAGGRGEVTVLTSPASGPLRLTPPRVEPGSAMKDKALPSPSSSEWQEFWDDEVGASYYYNCVTREALWVRPDGF